MYVFRNDTIAGSRRHHHRHRRRRRRCRRRCCISTDRGSIPYQRALGSLSFSRSWLSFGRAGFDRANKPSVAHQPTVESCSVSPSGLRERVAASLPSQPFPPPSPPPPPPTSLSPRVLNERARGEEPGDQRQRRPRERSSTNGTNIGEGGRHRERETEKEGRNELER